MPLATSAGWLVTHDASGAVVDLGLREVGDGKLRWLVQYEPAPKPPSQPAPPGPPPAGPPGGPPADESQMLPDEAWTRSEARIATAAVVIREVAEVRVVALTTGATLWRQTSQTPVAGIELVGDTVLVAADRLRAYAVGTGSQLWEAEPRGARVALMPGGRSVVVAGEQGISAHDRNGATCCWQRSYPDTVRDATPDRITVDGATADDHRAQGLLARAARHRRAGGRARLTGRPCT